LYTSIRSFFHVSNQTHLLSNEDMQQTFENLGENRIISYVDYFSYPYVWNYYRDITNQFPDGLFTCVREVSLFDERPFEHEFFIRIAEAFSLLEKLSVHNRTPQQQQQLINNKKNLSLIEYPHLTELDCNCVHDDYIK